MNKNTQTTGLEILQKGITDKSSLLHKVHLSKNNRNLVDKQEHRLGLCNHILLLQLETAIM